MSQDSSPSSEAQEATLRLGVVRGREPVVRFANGDRAWLAGQDLCEPGSEMLVAWDGRRVVSPVAVAPAGAHGACVALVAESNVVLFAVCEGAPVSAERLRSMRSGEGGLGQATVVGEDGQECVVVSETRGIVDPKSVDEGEQLRTVAFRVRAFNPDEPNGVVRSPDLETAYHAFLLPNDWVAEGAPGYWLAEADPAPMEPQGWVDLADRYLDPICDGEGRADGALNALEMDGLRLRAMAAG